MNGNPEARFAGVPARNVTVRVDLTSAKRQLRDDLSCVSFRGIETEPILEMR